MPYEGAMMRVRILVCDQAEASFYDASQPNQPLLFIGRLLDPDAHLHNRELRTDRPGRVFDHAAGTHRRGATAHHATGGERNPRKIEAQRFAHRIVAELVQARRHGEFERLVVMAGPAFLGRLRDAMPASLRAVIAAEIPKDIVHEPPAAVQWYLPPNAFAPYPAAASAARRR